MNIPLKIHALVPAIAPLPKPAVAEPEDTTIPDPEEEKQIIEDYEKQKEAEDDELVANEIKRIEAIEDIERPKEDKSKKDVRKENLDKIKDQERPSDPTLPPNKTEQKDQKLGPEDRPVPARPVEENKAAPAVREMTQRERNDQFNAQMAANQANVERILANRRFQRS